MCIHNKPIGLLNVNDFYGGLLSFLDNAVEQNFMSHSTRQILISASTADQLIDQLQAYVPAPDPALALLKWPTKDNSKKRHLDLDLNLSL